MKKLYLTLLTAFMLGFVNYAQAQYVHKNPLSLTTNNQTMKIKFGVADSKLNYLPQDTVMPLSAIAFAVATETFEYVAPEKEDTVFLTFKGLLKTYYDQICDNTNYPLAAKDLSDAQFCDYVSFVHTDVVKLDRAGVFKWEQYIESQPELGHHGTVQFNRSPAVTFNAQGPDKGKPIYNTQKFTLSGRVYSGYPYDVKKYQGNCRVKVFDPDSIVISDFDVLMEATSDSAKLEYQKPFDVCKVDSAKEGNYRVEIYPCWATDTVRYTVSVINPLANATTKDPADATYRFKNMTFNESEMSAWNYTGKPLTVVNTEEGNAIINKKENEDDDESFNISQTVAKMPKGWYELKWRGYYQPAKIDSVTVADPVLAKIYGGSTETPIKHIYDAFRVNYNNGYYELKMPYQNEAIASELSKSQSSLNTMNFEVGEDSIVTIGAKATISKHVEALTALGAVTLKYYGKGLPYGDVLFGADKYNAEDSIKVEINLYNGPGGVVPADNKISVVVCSGTQLDEKNIIDAKEIDAPAAGKYNYGMVVPKSDEFNNGTYTIFITSINMDGTYQLKESKAITLSGGKDIPTDVKAPTSVAKANTGVAYDVAGRVVDANTAKGIIIIDGKKSIK